MNITDLKPEIVWRFFDQVTRVPRPSKKEGKMIQFLESFAKEYKITLKKDEAGNILMSKPATPGMEDRPTVVLQSHMDMVCEKNNGTEHDFENDPIETIIDGEWVRANGTTLGADNGIGIAAELAVLASEDIQHGPIECLFTVDEETGLTGAKALKEGFMTGSILLNLDSEDEGEIFMGCAGGKDTHATFHYEPTPTSDEMLFFRIDVKGLNGGHSGGEIHKGLGNANKILVRFLFLLEQRYDFVLCSIDGGNLRNAIAREAHAIIGLHSDNKEDVRVMLNHFAADVENELKHVDPKVRLTMESAERPAYHIDRTTAEKLIYALHACPHGVMGMSHDIEGPRRNQPAQLHRIVQDRGGQPSCLHLPIGRSRGSPRRRISRLGAESGLQDPEDRPRNLPTSVRQGSENHGHTRRIGMRPVPDEIPTFGYDILWPNHARGTLAERAAENRDRRSMVESSFGNIKKYSR